jgi:hypothetical protein
MKRNNFWLLSIFAFINMGDLPVENSPADTWSGTVSCSIVVTGPDIATSEWKMDGTFQNSEGSVLHSSKYQSVDGKVKKSCSVTSPGRLVIEIDQARGTYTVMVCGVKDCVGTSFEYGKELTYTVPGGDTAIVIDSQKLGSNAETLAGTLNYKEGPHGRGLVQTQVFKWSLVKSRE